MLFLVSFFVYYNWPKLKKMLKSHHNDLKWLVKRVGTPLFCQRLLINSKMGPNRVSLGGTFLKISFGCLKFNFFGDLKKLKRSKYEDLFFFNFRIFFFKKSLKNGLEKGYSLAWGMSFNSVCNKESMVTGIGIRATLKCSPFLVSCELYPLS